MRGCTISFAWLGRLPNCSHQMYVRGRRCRIHAQQPPSPLIRLERDFPSKYKPPKSHYAHSFNPQGSSTFFHYTSPYLITLYQFTIFKVFYLQQDNYLRTPHMPVQQRWVTPFPHWYSVFMLQKPNPTLFYGTWFISNLHRKADGRCDSDFLCI